MAIFFTIQPPQQRGNYYCLSIISCWQFLPPKSWYCLNENEWAFLYCTLYDFYQQMTSFPFINKPTIKTVRQSVRIYILSSSFFFTQKETLMNAFFNERNLWSYWKKKSFLYWLNLGFSLFYNYNFACTIPKA